MNNQQSPKNNFAIQSLRLQNFKCFEDQVLRLRPLTLLSGLNSTGKSSVIQSLLLLRQSYQQGLLQKIGLALNGDLIHIGTAIDALFEGAKGDSIGFDLSLENGIEKQWRFQYDQEVDVLSLSSSELEGEMRIYDTSLFKDNFHYLQAERLGPRRFFETSDFLVRQRRQLGTAGEYAAHFLSVFGDNAIAHQPLAHPNAVSLSLRAQVEAWLGEISPGTLIALSPSSNTDTISLQFSFATSNKYRATNVGFGITYVLPILIAILSSSAGSLLLIENPEAHLHPKGQAEMGALLARAASCGIQVVIETHSDHVLNGIRVAVHDGMIEPQDTQLHFFQRTVRDEQVQNEVTPLLIDHNGRIDHWPDGFFDEWDKSLEALLEPRNG
jgi:predicted ATPase